MNTLRQRSTSSREIGASETRLFAPKTTRRRTSFESAQPPGTRWKDFESRSRLTPPTAWSE